MIRGLPAPAAGSVLLASAFSAVVSTAGLVLLRGTRPSQVEALPPRVGRPGKLLWFLYSVLGVFGALLLFIGLALGSIPMLMGVSTDEEGKGAMVVQCLSVLLCWVAERYFLLGEALPSLQSCACAIVWFGSTLVEWAGPRPYDNVSLGLGGQVAGCDGGYRSPFLIYAALWLTGVTFGTLLLFCEEGAPLIDCSDARGVGGSGLEHEAPGTPSCRGRARERPPPHALRRKALPVIYGLATSMSGFVFATGAASAEMSWIFFGALLLVVAVVCAWDWLWRLELTLGSWAPLSHGCATLLRLAQAHLVFRDFRWDPESVHGFLVVRKIPGLPLFLLGVLLLVATLTLFKYTSNWRDWSASTAAGDGLGRTNRTVASDSDDGSKLDFHSESFAVSRHQDRQCRLMCLLQWLLLPICVGCLLNGVSMPLIETEVTMPDVAWLHEAGAIERFKNSTRPGDGHHMKSGSSYLDLVTLLYDRRLPCSALVVAYNSMITPPLQFISLILVMLRPAFVPPDLLEEFRKELMNQAPFRFTNPMVLMIMVGFLNLPGPGHSVLGASFTKGFWYFIVYCTTSVLLAWSLEVDADRHQGRAQVEPTRDSERLSHAGEKTTPSRSRTAPSHASHASHASDCCPELDLGLVALGHGVGPHLQHNGGKDEKALLSRYSRSAAPGHDDSEDADSDVEDCSRSEVESTLGGDALTSDVCLRGWEAASVVALILVIGVTMYFGLTRPFLNFEYRLSGVVIKKSEPTVFELWRSLAKESMLLGCFAATTLIFVFVLWFALFALRLSGEPPEQHAALEPDCGGHCRRVGFLEQMVRPWVMGHIWAFSIVMIYYIVTARNKAVIEVCAHFPDQPVGLLAIIGMGLGILGVMMVAKGVTAPPRAPSRSREAIPLPGGIFVWGLGPVALAAFWCVVLYSSGPKLKPEIAGIDDINDVFSKLLPTANMRLHAKIPDSAGDCEALRRQERNHQKFHRCAGHAPLAHRKLGHGSRAMDVTAMWVTGLNTLEIMDIVVTHSEGLPSQRWNLSISGMFTNLHVWLKVLIGDKEWVNDYWCCDKALHFTVQASAVCEEGHGFHRVHLHVLHIDPIEFVHKFRTIRGGWYQIDYGRSAEIEKALANIMTGQTGRLLIKNSDGSTTDPLRSASNVLEDIVVMNTGRRCLHNI